MAVKVLDVKLLDMREDLHPQVIHDLLTCPVHQISLKERKDKLSEKNQQKDKGDSSKTLEVSAANVLIDSNLGQIRAYQLKSRDK